MCDKSILARVDNKERREHQNVPMLSVVIVCGQKLHVHVHAGNANYWTTITTCYKSIAELV